MPGRHCELLCTVTSMSSSDDHVLNLASTYSLPVSRFRVRKRGRRRFDGLISTVSRPWTSQGMLLIPIKINLSLKHPPSILLVPPKRTPRRQALSTTEPVPHIIHRRVHRPFVGSLVQHRPVRALHGSRSCALRNPHQRRWSSACSFRAAAASSSATSMPTPRLMRNAALVSVAVVMCCISDPGRAWNMGWEVAAVPVPGEVGPSEGC